MLGFSQARETTEKQVEMVVLEWVDMARPGIDVVVEALLELPREWSDCQLEQRVTANTEQHF